MCAKVEDGLIALEARVRAGRLSDPAKIGAAADRILRDSGVGRCFKTTVRKGLFSWDFDEKARRYDEELLCGRYVITTSLDKDEVSAAQVVRYYRSLQNVEHRFRVLKDFLDLRPIFHWTEDRVRGHVALCVMAATIEAVMAKDLVERQGDGPRSSLPVHDAASGLVLVERGPPRARLGRRSQHRARQPAKRHSRPRCSGPSTSTPRPGTRPQSPEQGVHLTRSGNTFSPRCHLPGMTRKSRQSPVLYGSHEPVVGGPGKLPMGEQRGG